VGLVSTGGRTSLLEADFTAHISAGETVGNGKTFVEQLLGAFWLRIGTGLASVDEVETGTGNLTVPSLPGEINDGGDADDDVLPALELDESPTTGQFLSSSGVLFDGYFFGCSSPQRTGDGTVSVVPFCTADVTTRLG